MDRYVRAWISAPFKKPKPKKVKFRTRCEHLTDERKITEIRAAMDSMRVLGKPLNYKEVKTTMETNKTGRGFPLSAETRAKVVDLRKAGMTLSQITNALNIGKSSVCRILKAAAEEKEPAPVAAETSSEWECVTSDTLTISNDTTDKAFCQVLLDDIDTAIKMLMECVYGEDIYSSIKAAFDIGEVVAKLRDAYNKLEEVVYDDGK
ncbi:MAG: helix-turn-helix domain-containing protein [Ruminiclostridium sp.]|nr:helix-turn-helix domain-containing protein [Ruminiclostridium sp.]